MASRTQLRLGQITGSFGDREGGIIQSRAASPAANLAAYTAPSGSMVGIMSDIVSQLVRIHGGNTFAGGEVSTLKDLDGNTRITYVADGKTLLSGSGTDADSVDIHSPNGGILLDVDKNNKKIHLDSAGGVDIDAGGVMTLDSELRLGITSNAGDIELLANATNKKVHIKSNMTNVGVGIHIDGNAGVNQVVDIDGGKVSIDSENTGADSMTLDSLGGISIDAAAASNFSTSGGVITINGKTGVNIQEDGSNVIAISDTKELTLGVAGQDVIIAGDLQIQGTTTTVSSSNTTIKDSIIGLGVTGSNTFNNVGDRAIIFARGANSSVALPALNFKQGTTRFELATYAADPSSGSMGDAASFLDLKVNNLQLVGGLALPDSVGDHTLTLEANGDDLSANRTLDFIVADASGDDANRTLHIEASTVKLDQDYTVDADVQFNQVTANGGLIADNITIDGTEIDLSSGNLLIDVAGKLTLDSDDAIVQLDDAGTEYGSFRKSSSGDLVVSSSLDKKVILDSHDGKIQFKTSAGLTNTEFELAAGGLVQFVDNYAFAQFETSPGSERLILSGTHLALSGAGPSPQELRFFEPTTAGENYVAIEAPDTLASNYTISLPQSIGTAGQVLKIASVGSSDALLEFAAESGADLARFAAKVTSTIAADTTVKFRTGDFTSGITALKGTQLNITKADNLLDKSLEVFVNGQLLMSGSQDGDDTDYTFINSGSIRFEFGLELDDIIQIIQR